ncbi:hypothetical protein Vafri_12879 [Volvox africanus]|uniref:Uncharacterized protein n=1 Tax=Volvox africanus TaxID=51714 RepID=A0A8J4BFH3_9CHLO|nr:hypothetical protein Vafri_12879 [Volvox africanus]
MLPRQLYIGHGGVHHTWLDRTQGVVLLTGQVNYALRHNSPVSHRGKNVACSFGCGSRADPHATAEPASHAISRLTPDQAAEPPAPSERSETTKAADNPQLVSAALLRPSSEDLQRLDRDGGEGPLLVDGGGIAAMESCSATPPNATKSQRRPRSTLSRSPPPEAAAFTSREASEHAQAPSIIPSESSIHKDRKDASRYPQVAVDGVSIPGGSGHTGSGGATYRKGIPLPPVYRGLDSLVASALAFDEATCQGDTWGDGNWELEDLRPLDAEAADMPNSSSSGSSSSRNAPSYSSPGGGRRRRRAGGGTSLDDEEGTWDFEAYDDERTNIDDGGVAEAAAAGTGASSSSGFRDPDAFIARSGPLGRGPPLTQRGSNDDDEAGSPADSWSQRRGRDGRGRRGRGGGRWWEEDWEDGGYRNGNDRAPGAPTRGWLRASDPGSGLNIEEWGDTESDDLKNVDAFWTRGGGMSDDVGGGMGDRSDGGGGLRGGRRAVIASESALRRDLVRGWSSSTLSACVCNMSNVYDNLRFCWQYPSVPGR